MSSISNLSPAIEKLRSDLQRQVDDLTEIIASGGCVDHARYLADCAMRDAYIDTIQRIDHPQKPKSSGGE